VEHWDRWDVRLLDDTTPWTRPEFCSGERRVVYLAAESPNTLDKIQSDTTYVIGGLIDHTAKPGLSFDRASLHEVETARLPLSDVIDLREKGGSADISTLAVVQLLLLRREFDTWGEAISRCPALRCAPLRKYVRWRSPYVHLNEAPPPQEVEWLDGWARGDSTNARIETKTSKDTEETNSDLRE
jgi:hypothetical protein